MSSCATPKLLQHGYGIKLFKYGLPPAWSFGWLGLWLVIPIVIFLSTKDIRRACQLYSYRTILERKIYEHKRRPKVVHDVSNGISLHAIIHRCEHVYVYVLDPKCSTMPVTGAHVCEGCAAVDSVMERQHS